MVHGNRQWVRQPQEDPLALQDNTGLAEAQVGGEDLREAIHGGVDLGGMHACCPILVGHDEPG